MKKRIKVMPIIGTRPEGIKMAPLIKRLREDEDIECVFVNTAQHREQLDQVLSLFQMRADYDLDIMKQQQTPEQIIATIITKMSDILENEKPDLVLVHGDTSTTFVGGMAAFLKQIPVGHVEAGLRTYNIYSPFPEEINRQLVGRLATYHFAATETNRENLMKERVSDEYISVVGNSVIDALLDVTNRPFEFSGELKSITENGLRTILMTTHRRENLEQLKGIYDAVNQLLQDFEDIQIVFPMHKNPKVREKVHASLNNHPRVHLVEPLDYELFANMMKHSYMIITDSGGIQEEAPALGKPVLVARNTTERQEGVEAGTLKLVGTDRETIYKEAKELLTNESLYTQMSQAVNPYGTGNTCEQIIKIIKERLGEVGS